MRNDFKRALKRSALGHTIVIVVGTILSGISLSPYRAPLEVAWVELPKGSSEEIGRGVKKIDHLPKTTIQEQKKPASSKKQPKEALKAPAQKKTPPVQKKKPKKLSAEEKKIKEALATINKELKEERGAPSEAAQIEEHGDGYKFGTSNEPLRVDPNDPEYLKYQAEVRMKIISEWIIPPRFAEEDPYGLNTRLAVQILDNGEVSRIEWVSKSGHEAFDTSAIRAIKRASPLPKPPERLSWEAYNEGFLIEFDPKLKP